MTTNSSSRPGLFRPRFGRTLWAIFLLFAGSELLAQQATDTGVVRGRVANRATGDYLQGAQVRLQGTGRVVTTERDGSFRLQAPAGEQTVVISFTGLDPVEETVRVRAGQVSVLDVIEMSSRVYQMEEVSVAGIREGNALAIQLQRQATNIKNVAATDTFGNPAANPGELIQRLPGITTDIVGGEVRQIQIRGMDRTFNSVMLDGNRVANAGSASYIREVQIEQMGTHNIERVEVIKAPTPDMDADAIAGFVNLVTKRAFDRPPGRRITYNIGTVWKVREDDGSPEKDSPGLDLLAATYSEVFSVLGGENNLGLSASALYRHGYTLQDEVQHLYRFQGFDEPGDQLIQRRFRTREFVNPDYTTNVGVGADYEIADGSFLYLKLTANQRNQYQRYRGGQWLGTTNPALYTPASNYGHTIGLPSDRHRFEVFSGLFSKKAYNYTINGGGEHALANDWLVKYDLFHSFASTNYPDRNDISAEVDGVGIEIDRREREDPWYPAVGFSGADLFDPDLYRLENLTFFRHKSTHTVQGARMDFQRDFDTAVPTYIKTGFKWGREQRARDWDRSRFRYVGADGEAGTADDSITPYLDPNYDYKQSGGRYGPWPTMQIPDTGQPGDIAQTLATNPEFWVQDHFYTATQSIRYDSIIDETVKAAYMMGNIDFGGFRILGGFRVEQTEVEGENVQHIISEEEQQRRDNWTGPVTPEEQIRRAQAEYPEWVESSGQYRDVFPGVHFVYEPMDGLLLRASWNTSITRPSIGHILPGFEVDEEDQRITIGNPDLQPFYSNNFEFGFEKYFEPVGIFGAGVFLKEIENYSRTIITEVPAGEDNGFQGEFVGYELRQRQNAGDARIRGFELNYQQQMSFLPGFWRGFGTFANFTYLDAQGNFGGTRTTTRLSGMTPRSGNAGISYVNYGLQARLMVNWRDRHYRGGSGPDALWREERTLLDLKLQYAISRNFDIFLDAANLTNEATRADEYEFRHKRFQTVQGISFTAGVKGRF